MPANTCAPKRAAVVNELLTAGSKTWLKTPRNASLISLQISRLPNMPVNAAIMLLSCAIKELD